jgi:kumamolisin
MADDIQLVSLLDSAPTVSHAVTWGKKVAADEVMSVTIVLKPSKPHADLIQKVRDVESALPLSRPTISDDEFEEIHRPDDIELDAFTQFATDAGLDVTGTSTHRHSLDLKGSVGNLNKAFNVELRYCELDGERHIAHKQDLSLPAHLRDRVQAVVGLDDFPEGGEMRPFLSAPASVTTLAAGHTPIEIAERYDFPRDLDGSGQRIAIVALAGGYHQDDLDYYFGDVLGLPAGPKITPVSVSQGGPSNNPTPKRQLGRLVDDLNDGELSFKDIASDIDCGTCLRRFMGTLETTMDIQVAGAIAPGAEILVLFPGRGKQGWLDAIHAAIGINSTGAEGGVANPASILSISWGSGECRNTAGFKYAINEALKMARDKYITVCCASGDLGSFGVQEGVGYDKYANVCFPASSPWVLACGGTSLVSENGEVAWNAPWKGERMATGGGASGFFRRRTWQDGCNVPRHADYFLDGNGYSSVDCGEHADRDPPEPSRTSSDVGDSWLKPDHCRLWSNPKRVCEVYHQGLSDFVGRGVPDVSGNADGATGYRLYVGGRQTILGGTSAVAPLWSGLIARINQRLAQMAADTGLDHSGQVGYLNRLLYTNPKVQDALTSVGGINNWIPSPQYVPAFVAGDGWDACTGLGVPNGAALLEALTEH